MLAAFSDPLIVQLDEVANIKSDQATSFRGSKGKLAFIRNPEALFLKDMHRIVTAFAQSRSKHCVDVLVEEKPELHRAQAAVSSGW